jgi:hypothetical protein
MTRSEHVACVEKALRELTADFGRDIYIENLRQAVLAATKEYGDTPGLDYVSGMLGVALKACRKKKDLNNRPRHFDAIGKAVASWSIVLLGNSSG